MTTRAEGTARSLLAVVMRSPRSARWTLTLTRVSSAVVFISFGIGKFANHASETASFRVYGLPAPGAFALVIGVLELAGGGLLLAGIATRLTALLLAGDMVAAIILSGVLHGEAISLTLAPVLLIAMLALVGLGPGRAALEDRRSERSSRARLTRS